MRTFVLQPAVVSRQLSAKRVVRGATEAEPLDVLREENMLLRQTIAEAKVSIKALETGLTEAGKWADTAFTCCPATVDSAFSRTVRD